MSQNQLNFSQLFSRTRKSSIVKISHSLNNPNKKLGFWIHLSKKDNTIPKIKDFQQHSIRQLKKIKQQKSCLQTPKHTRVFSLNFHDSDFSQDLSILQSSRTSSRQISSRKEIVSPKGSDGRQSTYNSSNYSGQNRQRQKQINWKKNRFNRVLSEKQKLLEEQNTRIFFRKDFEDLNIQGTRIM